ALTVLTLLISCAACGPGTAPQTVAPPPTVDALFDDVERRTFDYFWKLTDADRGLVLDRYPTPSFSSIAAIGFGLTAYGIGVERGYITRAQARARVLATLRFLSTAPQGPEATGNAGYHGFFYHFLEVSSGTRYRDSELSTVDTSLMMMGVLFVQSYFDGADAEETEIRTLAENLYEAIDWAWASPHAPGISMGWRPEQGFLDNDWLGYNEAMFLYVLALGSDSQTVDAGAWSVWTSTYDQTWGTLEGQEHLTFGPLFGHQYTAVWIDLRGLRDAYMRGRNLDYFENSRRAVYSQRAYATRNPLGWKGYGSDVWGLTACDGPTDANLPYNGQTRTFHTYAARGVNLDPSINFDDGTLAPTAVIGSLPFAPEIVIPAIRALRDRYGTEIYGEYGFFDAFNPSFDFDAPLSMGRRVPGFGWIDTDYLGIDQGPILAMIENHRTGFVWSVMKRNPHIRRGLERAGFTGGWLQ
ncbi:MAG: glucoamylase family protein, partial [Steroidobacteraceae bacterium]